MTFKLLIDNSAWARLDDDALPPERAEEIADALEAGNVVVCLPFLLEAGYSARDGADHDDLLDDLLTLDRVCLDRAIENRAVETQRQLARRGHHRLPPVDVLIAALADVHGLAILHYDADYDDILEHTDLRYESRWLAPRGSLS